MAVDQNIASQQRVRVITLSYQELGHAAKARATRPASPRAGQSATAIVKAAYQRWRLAYRGESYGGLQFLTGEK